MDESSNMSDSTRSEVTAKSVGPKGSAAPMTSFGQVIPMCSDDEWLAGEAAQPSSKLNLQKNKGRVTVFATPSRSMTQKQKNRKALNQSHATILGKMVTNLVGQLLESKEGTEVEVHVKIGGHTHNLIQKTFPAAPLPTVTTSQPQPIAPQPLAASPQNQAASPQPQAASPQPQTAKSPKAEPVPNNGQPSKAPVDSGNIQTTATGQSGAIGQPSTDGKQ